MVCWCCCGLQMVIGVWFCMSVNHLVHLHASFAYFHPVTSSIAPQVLAVAWMQCVWQWFGFFGECMLGNAIASGCYAEQESRGVSGRYTVWQAEACTLDLCTPLTVAVRSGV